MLQGRLKIRSAIQQTHLLKRLFLPIKLILFQTTFKDFIAAQFKHQRARQIRPQQSRAVCADAGLDGGGGVFVGVGVAAGGDGVFWRDCI